MIYKNYTKKTFIISALVLVLIITTLFVFPQKGKADYIPGAFITTWKTDNPGSSEDNQITIPTRGSGYNYNVDWGDSSSSMGVVGDITHTYNSSGTYTVSITGSFPRIYFTDNGDKKKILSVEQWGDIAWTSMSHAFYRTTNLVINATDTPNLSAVTDMSWMFYNTTLVYVNPSINSWDVSNVTDMSYLFSGASGLEQNFSSFNQNISSWNVSNVTKMNFMFSETDFNQNISSWNVSNVTDMSGMFFIDNDFNQDISSWNVSNVTNMSNMFNRVYYFNYDISSWNVSKVKNMSGMFQRAYNFNQDISSWDTSSVTNISWMFSSTEDFNQDISTWDVSKVTNMGYVFYNATSFDQNLSPWNVSNVTSMASIFSGSSLSTTNYDLMLSAWSLESLKSNVIFGAGIIRYCSSITARENVISTYNWTITDGGLGCPSVLTTEEADPITMTTATLNGTISEIGGINPTIRGFQYAEDVDYSPDNYTTTTIENGLFETGSYTKDIISLTCNTLYHYQSYATNSAGTGYGADETFSTSACPVPPTLTTISASSITPSTATLSGSIDATGGANSTVRGFQYTKDVDYAPGIYNFETVENGSFGEVSYTKDIISLTCNTLYHYQSYATNSAGTGYGADETFSTSACPVPPTLTTISASSITPSTATLSGSIDATGGANSTVRGFQYTKDVDYAPGIYNFETVENGSFGEVSYTKDIISLTCNTLYHYRSYATNSAGTGYGADETFSTSACPLNIPILTTGNATNKTASSATLNGTVDYGGAIPAPSQRGFRYGLDITYEFDTEGGEIIIIDDDFEGPPYAYQRQIQDLTCETEYHFIAYATNINGTGYGNDNTFTTNACPPPPPLPTVTTGEATPIGANSATLNGTIESDEGILSRGFEYGLDITYGFDTEGGGMMYLDNWGEIQRPISSLACETGYHFRAYAENITGKGYGADNTFTTGSCIYAPTLTTEEATGITEITETPDTYSATFNGTIVSDGGADIQQRGFKLYRGMTLSFIQDPGDPASFLEGPFSLNTNDFGGVSLWCGEENYYQSYAGNYLDIGYGDYLPFTTPSCSTAPSVVTELPSSYSDTSATIIGAIVDTGGEEPTERGFQYGVDTDYGEEITENGTFDVGQFLSEISPLTTCEPECHYRSYAVNSFGTGYGEDQTFTIESSDSDSVDDDDNPITGYVIPPIDSVISPILDTIGSFIESIISPFNNREDSNSILKASTFEGLENAKEFLFSPETVNDISNVISEPKKNILIKLIALVGIISGGLFSERLKELILAFFGPKRKKKVVPWGTVYDSVTKQPLDPAYVVLQDLAGKEVATSITDLDGRYGFMVPAGRYRIFVNKTNYQFPSKKLFGKNEDILYQDLYFGEIIEVKEGEIISKNIPMDSLKFDWNEFEKKNKKVMKFFSSREIWINRTSNLIFFIGLIFAIIATVLSPVAYNIIILIIYLLLTFLKGTILKPRAYGYIKQKTNNVPLSFAIIRVFQTDTRQEIIHKVADETGKYYCLLPNGKYYVKIEKKISDESYSEIYTSNPFEIKKGYINKKFEV